MPRDPYQTVKEIGDRPEVSATTVRDGIKDGALRAIDFTKGSPIADLDFEVFLHMKTSPARGEGLVVGDAPRCTPPGAERDA